MVRRRWWLLFVILLALLAVTAVAVIRARATHNRELDNLQTRTTRALSLIGVQGEIVSTGFDSGGSGSADCGIHVVARLSTTIPADEVSSRLLDPTVPVLAAVYRDHSTGGVVIVAQEPASTGADSVLDFRCQGAIPYDDQRPLPPPSRSARAPELRTATVWAGVERYCRLAAARTTMAIPCPTIAPVVAHPRSHWVRCRGLGDQLEGAGCSRQMFVLEEHFKGPSDYAGISGRHGPLPFGHLAVWAARGNAAGDQPCASPHVLGTARISTVSGRWYVCRAGGLNAGHIAFVWTADHVVYGVSLHRNSEVNRHLVERIVATLSIIHGN
jgi:hypothetical protein